MPTGWGRECAVETPCIRAQCLHMGFMKSRLSSRQLEEPGEGRGMQGLRFTLQGWPRKPTLGETAVLLCYCDQRPPSGGTAGLKSEQCRGLANARSLPYNGLGQALASPFLRPNEACCFLEAGANISHMGLSRRNPSVVQVGHASLRGPHRHSAGRRW